MKTMLRIGLVILVVIIIVSCGKSESSSEESDANLEKQENTKHEKPEASEKEKSPPKAAEEKTKEYDGLYVQTAFPGIQIKLPHNWDLKLHKKSQALYMHQLVKEKTMIANITYVKLPKRKYTISQMNAGFISQAKKDPAFNKMINKMIIIYNQEYKIMGHSFEINMKGKKITAYKFFFKGPKAFDCNINVNVVQEHESEMKANIEDIMKSII